MSTFFNQKEGDKRHRHNLWTYPAKATYHLRDGGDLKFVLGEREVWREGGSEASDQGLQEETLEWKVRGDNVGEEAKWALNGRGAWYRRYATCERW